MVSKRHKVFISYHHDQDQAYADKLRELYGASKAIIDKSMYDDLSHLETETILKKIRREHLLDSTVTVVLVGEHTWGRKWIDWEIYSSLRGYGERTINGLVGVYLPNHRRKHFRLTDNLRSGYAVKVKWESVEAEFIDAVHKAWNGRRRTNLIDNSRLLRERNAPLEPKDYSYLMEKEGTEGCFIATAVFGTPYANEIDVLRRWRDKRLNKSWYGQKFINHYYRYSPRIADFIRDKEWIKDKIRKGLTVILRVFEWEREMR